MNLELSEISQYIALFLSSGLAVDRIKAWVNRDEKKMRQDIDSHASKITSHDRRIQNLENDIKHLPDRESQHRMELSLTEMNGRFAAMDEKLKPISAISERLQELLMEQAKK